MFEETAVNNLFICVCTEKPKKHKKNNQTGKLHKRRLENE